jgi:hypothetical protein
MRATLHVDEPFERLNELVPTNFHATFESASRKQEDLSKALSFVVVKAAVVVFTTTNNNGQQFQALTDLPS